MTSRTFLRAVALGLSAVIVFVAALATATSATAATAPTPTPDTAKPRCSDARNCGRGGETPDPAVYAEVFYDGESPSRVVTTGTSLFAGCTWEKILAGQTLIIEDPNHEAVNINGNVYDRDHWLVHCPQLEHFDVYTTFAVGEPPPAHIINQMIADAYARTPVIAFNPQSNPNGDDITLIVGMTTFLWVDPNDWNTPVTATAALNLPDGTFAVTTTATAHSTRWTGGEDTTWCDPDDMHPYVYGTPTEDQPSNCTATYNHSSATHTNTITLDTTWTVSYTCTDSACGGTLPDITTTSTRTVQVGEFQVVNS